MKTKYDFQNMSRKDYLVDLHGHVGAWDKLYRCQNNAKTSKAWHLLQNLMEAMREDRFSCGCC